MAGVLGLAAVDLLRGTFPVMVILGPLMVAQERYWHRRLGEELATQAYRAAEARFAGVPGIRGSELRAAGSGIQASV